MLDKLKAREADLTKIIDQSVSNHNSIIGRLSEIKEWIKVLEEDAKKTSESVAEKVKEVIGEVV